MILEKHHFLVALIDEDFTVKEIANLLKVSKRTIYRRMNEFYVKIREYTDISDNELDIELRQLINQFPNCGERMMSGMLKNKGLYLQRSCIREAIFRVDHAGVQQRKKGTLQRRTYNVQGPNLL